MSLTLIVVILLVVLLLGGGYGWRRGGPGVGLSGGLLTVLVVLLILWLAGVFPR